jgi:hypothetical protein
MLADVVHAEVGHIEVTGTHPSTHQAGRNPQVQALGAQHQVQPVDTFMMRELNLHKASNELDIGTNDLECNSH